MVYDGAATVTVAGTRVPLLAATTDHRIRLACNLTVQNKPGNAGTIYVGGRTVSNASGIQLPTPGDTLTYPFAGANVYDLAEVYVDAANSNDVALFTYTVK